MNSDGGGGKSQSSIVSPHTAEECERHLQERLGLFGRWTFVLLALFWLPFHVTAWSSTGAALSTWLISPAFRYQLAQVVVCIVLYFVGKAKPVPASSLKVLDAGAMFVLSASNAPSVDGEGALPTPGRLPRLGRMDRK